MALIDLFFLGFLIFFVYLVYWSVKNDGKPLNEQTGLFRLRETTDRKPKPYIMPREPGPHDPRPR